MPSHISYNAYSYIIPLAIIAWPGHEMAELSTGDISVSSKVRACNFRQLLNPDTMNYTLTWLDAAFMGAYKKDLR